jgi:hypothetical protein
MKEFGVEFETEVGDTFWKQDLIQYADNENYSDTREHDKYFVAKESEGIFKAKHDDLGLTKEDLLPCVFNFKNNWMGLSIIGDYGIKEDEECFITMRDNKQFFMPEVEDE